MCVKNFGGRARGRFMEATKEIYTSAMYAHGGDINDREHNCALSFTLQSKIKVGLWPCAQNVSTTLQKRSKTAADLSCKAIA